jgi:hypothetical protein
MSGLPSFDAEYASSLLVDLGVARVRVLPLERILTSKRAANREKDRVAILQIEQTLKVLAAIAARRSRRTCTRPARDPAANRA